MAETEKAQAEHLKKQEDVKQALEQAIPPPEARVPKATERKTRAVALWVYAALLVAFFALWVLVATSTFPLSAKAADVLVWNEIKFQIAYDSDLEFVATAMREVAEEELGETMMERVKVYRELLAQTPVDHLQVQERPVVLFRVADSTWLEAIVRYIVDPKKAGRTKTDLIRKLLARLNAEPERVGFPKSNLR